MSSVSVYPTPIAHAASIRKATSCRTVDQHQRATEWGRETYGSQRYGRGIDVSKEQVVLVMERDLRKTRVKLATAIRHYIETWHNTRRRHSSLDMLTATEFENQHTTTAIAA